MKICQHHADTLHSRDVCGHLIITPMALHAVELQILFSESKKPKTLQLACTDSFTTDSELTPFRALVVPVAEKWSGLYVTVKLIMGFIA